MNQSDITYVLEILNEAFSSEDWDQVSEAIDALKEFLDDDLVDE
jgi:hypothetical protein